MSGWLISEGRADVTEVIIFEQTNVESNTIADGAGHMIKSHADTGP